MFSLLLNLVLVLVDVVGEVREMRTLRFDADDNPASCVMHIKALCLVCVMDERSTCISNLKSLY